MNSEQISSPEGQSIDASSNLGEELVASLVDKAPKPDDVDFEFAKTVVASAGELVRTALGNTYETHWKADNTPVTSIDITVNKFVIDRLKQAYPDDKVYGEEESSDGETKSGKTWVLDPIDGTQAIGKLDTFTICLARLDADGQPEFSMVLNPSRDEHFAAKRGEVATLNGEPIRVSAKDTVKGCYVHFGSGLRFDDLTSNGVAYDRLEQQGAKIINTRSLAFGCVEVAEGSLDGAYVGVKTPFEAASVKLIVEGAGGKATDLYGNDPGRLDGEIRGLVVSNGLIHDALVLALRKE